LERGQENSIKVKPHFLSPQLTQLPEHDEQPDSGFICDFIILKNKKIKKTPIP
jgi:hypothetical protein